MMEKKKILFSKLAKRVEKLKKITIPDSYWKEETEVIRILKKENERIEKFI